MLAMFGIGQTELLIVCLIILGPLLAIVALVLVIVGVSNRNAGAGWMPCPHCGKLVPRGAAFCNWCGGAIAPPAK